MAIAAACRRRRRRIDAARRASLRVDAERHTRRFAQLLSRALCKLRRPLHPANVPKCVRKLSTNI